MSHEVETLAYAGETPWHKLGTKVDGLMTANDALIKAGLDWLVELAPVDVAGIAQNEWKAVRRIKDGQVYQFVSNDYTPLQNADAFKFMDNVVGTGKAMYEVAGSLRKGARIWILANLKGSIDIKGEEIKRYLTLVSSHDGSLALQVFWTPVRVVCSNTLAMAMSNVSGERFYTKHTLNLQTRVREAQEILGLATKWYDEWKETATRLATLQLPAGHLPKLLAASFGLKPVQEVVEVSSLVFNQIEQCERVVMAQKLDNKSLENTLWWGFNGVAEYVDHARTYRGKDTDSTVRGAMFGGGNTIKQRAWDYCTEYAGIK